MAMDPRARLLAVADNKGCDVAEGALWLAAEDCPDVDVAHWLGVIDELAHDLAQRTDSRDGGAVPVMAELFRERLHLHGAGGGDPRNHYLHSVLERGKGVPIACSILWMSVGCRAGLEVEGVGLPGHFVVRVGGHLVDAFGAGEPMDDEAIRRVVGRALGRPGDAIQLDPHWLMATSPREIFARMSRNLRGCYASREDWESALRAADRCVALLHDSPVELRDRGWLRWRMGQHAGASSDLRTYLDEVPDAPDREPIERVLGELRASSN